MDKLVIFLQVFVGLGLLFVVFMLGYLIGGM